MEKFLPIIYVRGYAGTQGAVESTADKPYYGFNLGSTQVRTGPDGDPDFFIFESPLVRLIRDAVCQGFCRIFLLTVLSIPVLFSVRVSTLVMLLSRVEMNAAAPLTGA